MCSPDDTMRHAKLDLQLGGVIGWPDSVAVPEAWSTRRQGHALFLGFTTHWKEFARVDLEGRVFGENQRQIDREHRNVTQQA